MSRRLLEKRIALTLVFVAIAMSACTKAPLSGVNVRAIAVDLVFGIPPVNEPVAPADIIPELPKGTGFVQGPPPNNDPPPPPPVACPAAELTEFPAKEPLLPTGRPANGHYRWEIRGYQRYQFDTQTVSEKTVIPDRDIQIGNFTSREISGFRVVKNNRDVDYEWYSRELAIGTGRGAVQYKFQVDLPDEQVTTATSTPDGAGVYLSQIIVNPGTNNQETGDLQPRLPLLPLPAAAGKLVGPTRSVNSSDLSVLEVDGVVTKQQSVDVCGDVINSWYVEATRSYTYQTQDPRTGAPRAVQVKQEYNYGVSLARGGVIVIEHVESPPCQSFDNSPPAEESRDEKKHAPTGYHKCKTTRGVGFIEADLNLGQLIPRPAGA